MKKPGIDMMVVCGLVSALALGGTGCATATENDDPEVADEEMIGVTDLAAIEGALGLKKQTSELMVNQTALEAGACYRALRASPEVAPGFEMRRYQNGTSFFAKFGSGVNAGHNRPVLCVDLHGPAVKGALSGIALDAVMRYELGALEGAATNADGVVAWKFASGVIEIGGGATEEERVFSVRNRPHLQTTPLDRPLTISGPLERIRLAGVAIDVPAALTSSIALEMFGAPEEVSPATAALVYRYAWRKAEGTGVFSIADDAVGTFARKGWAFGDHGVFWQTLYFAKLEASQSSSILDPESETSPLSEKVALGHDLGASATPVNGTILPPVAECQRETSGSQPASPYGCTGL